MKTLGTESEIRATTSSIVGAVWGGGEGVEEVRRGQREEGRRGERERGREEETEGEKKMEKSSNYALCSPAAHLSASRSSAAPPLWGTAPAAGSKGCAPTPGEGTVDRSLWGAGVHCVGSRTTTWGVRGCGGEVRPVL